MHGFRSVGRHKVSAFLSAVALLVASVGADAATTNLPPSISGTPATWVYVGSQYSFRPSASDPEGAQLRFSISNKPAWASFSSSTGRIYGTPRSVGYWDNIRIQASDGTNTVALPLFTIRAASRSNVAPTISGSPPTSAVVGTAYTFQPSASDSNGDPLSFRISNKPSWASFSTSTGRLSGTPSSANVGTFSSISIRVTDGSKTVSLPAFSITVTGSTTPANRAPVISGAPATSVTAGQAYSFTPVASDADNNPLGFSIQNRPSWATFSTATGMLSGTPTTTQVGTYSNIVISVSDGTATAALPAFAITVSAPANTAPVISGSPITSVNAGSAYSFRPTASDPNGDVLTFSIANRPAWASFNTSTGQLSGSPSAAYVGTYANIVISVSDGYATTSLPAFAINVADVSIGGATLTWSPPTQNTDGSSLTNLTGYRIYYGAAPTELVQTIQVANAGLTAYVIENLSPGTYYFMVRAYTSGGSESDNSNVVTKLVQ